VAAATCGLILTPHARRVSLSSPRRLGVGGVIMSCVSRLLLARTAVLTIVILSSVSASAQERISPPAAVETSSPCPSNDKRKEELGKLIEERQHAIERLQDRAQVPKLIDLATTAGTAVAGITTGIGIGGQISNNSGLILIGYGCAACSWTAVLGGLIANLVVDHRVEDIAAIDATQKKIDDAAMSF